MLQAGVAKFYNFQQIFVFLTQCLRTGCRKTYPEFLVKKSWSKILVLSLVISFIITQMIENLYSYKNTHQQNEKKTTRAPHRWIFDNLNLAKMVIVTHL